MYLISKSNIYDGIGRSAASLIYSVPDNEAVETSCLSVFVAHKTIAGVRYCSAFDVEDCTEVLKHLNLISEVMSVASDMLLFDPHVLHNDLLLSQLYIELAIFD